MNQELTKRENQVVELIALGQSQKEVADALGISKATVDVIVKNAKAKLKIQKAPELSVWYFVNRYGITLNLTPEVKRVVSLSFLSLVLFVMVHGFLPERAARTVRTSARTNQVRRAGRRADSDIDTDFTLNIA